MLIIGAKGFAKEVLEVCHQNGESKNVAFYDDVNEDIGSELFNQFPVLHSLEQAKIYFETVDNQFTIGIGNPVLREKLTHQFNAIGGLLTSTISKYSEIGSFEVTIDEGANILSGVKISNSVSIGKCPLIYYNSLITHDVIIGDFVEISPGVTILGRAIIGNLVHLGAGSIILPNVSVGNNVVIGAGSVVTKNIPDNCVAVGVPANIIKYKLNE